MLLSSLGMKKHMVRCVFIRWLWVCINLLRLSGNVCIEHKSKFYLTLCHKQNGSRLQSSGFIWFQTVDALIVVAN